MILSVEYIGIYFGNTLKGLMKFCLIYFIGPHSLIKSTNIPNIFGPKINHKKNNEAQALQNGKR